MQKCIVAIVLPVVLLLLSDQGVENVVVVVSDGDHKGTPPERIPNYLDLLL